MWQSEKSRNDAILRLLAPHPALARLWHGRAGPGVMGPTNLAIEYVEHGSPLSSGEQLLLRVAFDLWNGGGGAKVGDLLDTLDARNLRAVCVALLQRDGGIVGVLDQALNEGDGTYRP